MRETARDFMRVRLELFWLAGTCEFKNQNYIAKSKNQKFKLRISVTINSYRTRECAILIIGKKNT